MLSEASSSSETILVKAFSSNVSMLASVVQAKLSSLEFDLLLLKNCGDCWEEVELSPVLLSSSRLSRDDKRLSWLNASNGLNKPKSV